MDPTPTPTPGDAQRNKIVIPSCFLCSPPEEGLETSTSSVVMETHATTTTTSTPCSTPPPPPPPQCTTPTPSTPPTLHADPSSPPPTPPAESEESAPSPPESTPPPPPPPQRDEEVLSGFLASPATSICSSEHTESQTLEAGPALPAAHETTPMAMMLEQSVGQHSADSEGMAAHLLGGQRRTSSMFVIDCKSEYTDVWQCDDKGELSRSDIPGGMRRLPSVRKILESETEKDLLNPLREIVGDAPMLFTTGSGIKSDILEGSCDRMKFARLKRAIQDTCGESDFCILSKQEEVDAVWKAVQASSDEATAVLYLGETIFGMGTAECTVCAEYNRQDGGEASLVYNIENTTWTVQDGVVVLVGVVAEMLETCCGLEWGVPYDRDTVLGETECTETTSDAQRLASAFLLAALPKYTSKETTIILDPRASFSMGAYVSHLDLNQILDEMDSASA